MHFNKKAAVRFTTSVLLIGTLMLPALALTGIVNTDGSVLRLRSQPSTDSHIITKLNDGAEVEILSETDNGWYEVTINNKTGFVAADYLLVETPKELVSAVTAPSPATAAVPQPFAEPLYGKVNVSALNVRSGPSTDCERVGKLLGSEIITLVGETENGWYQTEEGYISKEYVTLVDAAAAAASNRGQELADYALTYVGYPYVYGGSSPKGFDCSGFVKYVCANFGISVNRTASSQMDNGTSVSWDELQPGDLVFFKKGSSSKRASHVGIYIGGNQFVHASTSRTGVIISGMHEAYYTTGFVGARRVI